MIPLPRYFVLDTNILDKQQYNFESRELLDLKRHFTRRSITLLLPDPIEKEIRRHVKARAREASAALKSAQTQAPFVRKLPDWPLNKLPKQEVESTLLACVSAELDEFLAFYKVKRLGYDDVDVAAIMESYDKQNPPFGPGTKEKEFADAFAIAILDAFHVKTKESVIVISSDNDVRKACETRPHLLYFNSLGAFVGSVEARTNKLIATCRDLLTKNSSLLQAAIAEGFQNLGFTLREDWSAEIYDVTVDHVDLCEVNVTEARGLCCFASFTAKVSFRAEMSFDDYDTAIWDSEEKVAIPIHRHDVEMEQSTVVSGSAGVHLDSLGQHVTHIDDLEIDQDTITLSLHEDWM